MIRLVVALIEFATLAVPLLLVLALVWRLRWVAQRIAAAMTRALVLLVRLVLAAMAAIGCGLATFFALTTDERMGLPLAASFAVALLATATTLWLTRHWGAEVDALEMFGRPPVPRTVRKPLIDLPPRQRADHSSQDDAEASGARSTTPSAPPLITSAFRERLTATEAALARAARDDIDQPAAEWLTFWRRRGPDLIASAQDVWDDAASTARPTIAADLAISLEAIIAEADTRLAFVRQARHDLFTTRTNHARARVRGD